VRRCNASGRRAPTHHSCSRPSGAAVIRFAASFVQPRPSDTLRATARQGEADPRQHPVSAPVIPPAPASLAAMDRGTSSPPAPKRPKPAVHCAWRPVRRSVKPGRLPWGRG
jgi:hypothetical protein